VGKAAVAVALIALTACQAPPAVTPAASPAPTPLAIATPTRTPVPVATASPQPSPSAPEVSLAGIRAKPAGSLPDSFRYVAIDLTWAEGFRTRLWLVDLDAKRAPVVVAEWDGPASPVGEHSISADGKTVLISAKGSKARVALYLLRPETGTVATLFEEANVLAISPRISPDGQRFAFTRMPEGSPYDDGIWAGTAAGGELRRIVDQPRVTNVPRLPLAWSLDAVWVAFTTTKEKSEVALAHREGGPTIAVGDGDRVSWRRNPPELLVAANAATTSRLYTFDVNAKKANEIARIEKKAYAHIDWHPTLDRLAYQETAFGVASVGGEVWVRSADGSGASSIDLGRSVYAPQWSRDGTLLTALGGGDDSVTALIELFTGRRIAVLCKRGGTPPADCT
jgi:Tol biopolymer transport system component